MIKTIIVDFAQVLLFAKPAADRGKLGQAYAKLSGQDSIWQRYSLNDELMEFLQERQDQYQLAMLTASVNLPTHPEIRPKLEEVFERIFLTRELEFNKQQPGCYQVVLQKLKAEPESSLFIDDSHSRVAAAKEAGLKTVQYQNNQQLFTELKNLGIS